MILLGRSVSHAMVTHPLVHAAATTVVEALAALEDPQRHLLLLAQGDHLLGTLTRRDLLGAPACAPALAHARLGGRTVGPEEPLVRVRAEMELRRQRRRAVVDEEGRLLGLLCLKAHGRGFCSDVEVAQRSGERAGERRRDGVLVGT